jgi:hypothetical protein
MIFMASWTNWALAPIDRKKRQMIMLKVEVFICCFFTPKMKDPVNKKLKQARHSLWLEEDHPE